MPLSKAPRPGGDRLVPGAKKVAALSNVIVADSKNPSPPRPGRSHPAKVFPRSIVIFPRSIVVFPRSIVVVPETIVVVPETIVVVPEMIVVVPETIVVVPERSDHDKRGPYLGPHRNDPDLARSGSIPA